MGLPFLIDEDLRGVLWRAIQRRNLLSGETLDVVRVGDVPDLPLGSLDPENIAWAERENRILVSRDKRTLGDHLEAHLQTGRHSPSVFVLRRRCSIPDVVAFLVEVAYRSDPAEWRDRIEFIP